MFWIGLTIGAFGGVLLATLILTALTLGKRADEEIKNFGIDKWLTSQM